MKGCRVSVIGKVGVGLPAENVLAALWEISNLGDYEPKVDFVRVMPETEMKGRYSAAGRFAGIRWSGRFFYKLNRRGFHSEMVEGPPGVGVYGGFVVKPEGPDRCAITHYERYQFPRWLLPLTVPLRVYLSWTIRKELRNLVKVITGRD